MFSEEKYTVGHSILAISLLILLELEHAMNGINSKNKKNFFTIIVLL